MTHIFLMSLLALGIGSAMTVAAIYFGVIR